MPMNEKIVDKIILVPDDADNPYAQQALSALKALIIEYFKRQRGHTADSTLRFGIKSGVSQVASAKDPKHKIIIGNFTPPEVSDDLSSVPQLQIKSEDFTSLANGVLSANILQWLAKLKDLDLLELIHPNDKPERFAAEIVKELAPRLPKENVEKQKEALFTKTMRGPVGASVGSSGAHPSVAGDASTAASVGTAASAALADEKNSDAPAVLKVAYDYHRSRVKDLTNPEQADIKGYLSANFKDVKSITNNLDAYAHFIAAGLYYSRVPNASDQAKIDAHLQIVRSSNIPYSSLYTDNLTLFAAQRRLYELISADIKKFEADQHLGKSDPIAAERIHRELLRVPPGENIATQTKNVSVQSLREVFERLAKGQEPVSLQRVGGGSQWQRPVKKTNRLPFLLNLMTTTAKDLTVAIRDRHTTNADDMATYLRLKSTFQKYSGNQAEFENYEAVSHLKTALADLKVMIDSINLNLHIQKIKDIADRLDVGQLNSAERINEVTRLRQELAEKYNAIRYDAASVYSPVMSHDAAALLKSLDSKKEAMLKLLDEKIAQAWEARVNPMQAALLKGIATASALVQPDLPKDSATTVSVLEAIASAKANLTGMKREAEELSRSMQQGMALQLSLQTHIATAATMITDLTGETNRLQRGLARLQQQEAERLDAQRIAADKARVAAEQEASDAARKKATEDAMQAKANEILGHVDDVVKEMEAVARFPEATSLTAQILTAKEAKMLELQGRYESMFYDLAPLSIALDNGEKIQASAYALAQRKEAAEAAFKIKMEHAENAIATVADLKRVNENALAVLKIKPQTDADKIGEPIPAILAKINDAKKELATVVERARSLSAAVADFSFASMVTQGAETGRALQARENELNNIQRLQAELNDCKQLNDVRFAEVQRILRTNPSQLSSGEVFDGLSLCAALEDSLAEQSRLSTQLGIPIDPSLEARNEDVESFKRALAAIQVKRDRLGKEIADFIIHQNGEISKISLQVADIEAPKDFKNEAARNDASMRVGFLQKGLGGIAEAIKNKKTEYETRWPAEVYDAAKQDAIAGLQRSIDGINQRIARINANIEQGKLETRRDVIADANQRLSDLAREADGIRPADINLLTRPVIADLDARVARVNDEFGRLARILGDDSRTSVEYGLAMSAVGGAAKRVSDAKADFARRFNLHLGNARALDAAIDRDIAFYSAPLTDAEKQGIANKRLQLRAKNDEIHFNYGWLQAAVNPELAPVVSQEFMGPLAAKVERFDALVADKEDEYDDVAEENRVRGLRDANNALFVALLGEINARVLPILPFRGKTDAVYQDHLNAYQGWFARYQAAISARDQVPLQGVDFPLSTPQTQAVNAALMRFKDYVDEIANARNVCNVRFDALHAQIHGQIQVQRAAIIALQASAQALVVQVRNGGDRAPVLAEANRIRGVLNGIRADIAARQRDLAQEPADLAAVHQRRLDPLNMAVARQENDIAAVINNVEVEERRILFLNRHVENPFVRTLLISNAANIGAGLTEEQIYNIFNRMPPELPREGFNIWMRQHPGATKAQINIRLISTLVDLGYVPPAGGAALPAVELGAAVAEANVQAAQRNINSLYKQFANDFTNANGVPVPIDQNNPDGIVPALPPPPGAPLAPVVAERTAEEQSARHRTSLVNTFIRDHLIYHDRKLKTPIDDALVKVIHDYNFREGTYANFMHHLRKIIDVPAGVTDDQLFSADAFRRAKACYLFDNTNRRRLDADVDRYSNYLDQRMTDQYCRDLGNLLKKAEHHRVNYHGSAETITKLRTAIDKSLTGLEKSLSEYEILEKLYQEMVRYRDNNPNVIMSNIEVNLNVPRFVADAGAVGGNNAWGRPELYNTLSATGKLRQDILNAPVALASLQQRIQDTREQIVKLRAMKEQLSPQKTYYATNTRTINSAYDQSIEHEVKQAFPNGRRAGGAAQIVAGVAPLARPAHGMADLKLTQASSSYRLNEVKIRGDQLAVTSDRTVEIDGHKVDLSTVEATTDDIKFHKMVGATALDYLGAPPAALPLIENLFEIYETWRHAQRKNISAETLNEFFQQTLKERFLEDYMAPISAVDLRNFLTTYNDRMLSGLWDRFGTLGSLEGLAKKISNVYYEKAFRDVSMFSMLGTHILRPAPKYVVLAKAQLHNLRAYTDDLMKDPTTEAPKHYTVRDIADKAYLYAVMQELYSINAERKLKNLPLIVIHDQSGYAIPKDLISSAGIKAYDDRASKMVGLERVDPRFKEPKLPAGQEPVLHTDIRRGITDLEQKLQDEYKGLFKNGP